MKTFIASILFLSILQFGIGQSKTAINMVPRVEKVTLYPEGVFMECSASKFMGGGKQLLRFSGLPAGMVPSSIQVSSGSGVEVLSVSYEKNFLQSAGQPEWLRQLTDSLRTYEFDFRFNENMLKVYEQERNMILANQKIGWEKVAFVVEDLEDLSDFYRDRLADIMLKSMEIESRQSRVERNLHRIRQQLKATGFSVPVATGDVFVEVAASGNGTAAFSLSFFAEGAGWEPHYQVMVEKPGAPLKLVLKAEIHQNTGMDWEQVSLVLSAEGRMDGEKTTGTGVFTVGQKVSLPAMTMGKTITVDAFALPASYEYHIAATGSAAAMLVAHVSNAAQHGLPSGEADVFLEGLYMGKSYLQSNMASDTISVPLRQDSQVALQKRIVSRSMKTGKRKKETVEVELTLRNARKTPVKVEVKDAMPAFQEGATVKMEDAKGANYSAVKQELTWQKAIPPATVERMRYKYSLTYPEEGKKNE